MALLLHLIRQEEMDIFDININQITHQYLEYIKAMKKLDLEMAGDFVAMAATLIHIKSKMLLPQYDPETGEPLQEDPRQELVQKLVEYQKFQQLAKDLYKLPLLGRDVFTRGYRTDIDAAEEGELILEEKPLFSMIKAYRTAMKNMKKTIHRVIGELQSIAARIMEMKDQLVVGVRVPFTELLKSSTHQHNQVLVTFLSLLELAKMGLVSLFQADPMTEIHVEAKKSIDRDVISNAESYENQNAEGKADAIFAAAAAEALTAPTESPAASVSLDEGTMDYDQQELPLTGEIPVAERFEESASDEDILAAERELGFIEAKKSSDENSDESNILVESFTEEIIVEEHKIETIETMDVNVVENVAPFTSDTHKLSFLEDTRAVVEETVETIENVEAVAPIVEQKDEPIVEEIEEIVINAETFDGEKESEI